MRLPGGAGSATPWKVSVMTATQETWQRHSWGKESGGDRCGLGQEDQGKGEQGCRAGALEDRMHGLCARRPHTRLTPTAP